MTPYKNIIKGLQLIPVKTFTPFWGLLSYSTNKEVLSTIPFPLFLFVHIFQFYCKVWIWREIINGAYKILLV